MFDLLKELEYYQPFDDNEKLAVQKTIEFLKSHKNCYSRTNHDGHVTAGALVCHTDGRILLNHHKETNMWFQFGGHSDGNSNSFEVAKREVLEETGITSFVEQFEKILDVGYEEIEDNPFKKEPPHFHYDINFLFITDQNQFNISNESKDIKWATLDEAKQLASPEDHSMQRMLKKYEKYLKNRKN